MHRNNKLSLMPIYTCIQEWGLIRAVPLKKVRGVSLPTILTPPSPTFIFLQTPPPPLLFFGRPLLPHFYFPINPLYKAG